MVVWQVWRMDVSTPPIIRRPISRRLWLFLKIAGICLLIALLHIPLAMTQGVLNERLGYRSQAIAEISGVWGGAQTLSGPVLVVPYGYATKVIRPKAVGGKVVQVEEEEMAQANAYFLPERLRVDGDVDTEMRHRGIYQAAVYSTRLAIEGDFRPDFVAAGIPADRIDWQRARLVLAVSDLRGMRSVTPVRAGGKEGFEFEAVGAPGVAQFPLAAKLDGVASAGGFAFAFEVSLQGSERLMFAPAGKVMDASLRSAWPDPSFGGGYLPVKREIGEHGFRARWETSHFSRGFPQYWTDRVTDVAAMARQLEQSAFGVTFAQPVDGYRLVERAKKYGVLFFVLVFAVFFLFEVTAGLRIHPLQYAMIGAALCLFFLGFLALSELIETGAAYLCSAGACTLMVALYSWSFLRSGGRTLVIGGGLASTYGYLYFVLKSQDYALVAGTAALFAALGLVMFCTRRLNWYGLEAPEGVAAQ